MVKLLIVSFAVSLLAFTSIAESASPKKAPFLTGTALAAKKPLIERLEYYLSHLDSIISDFKQVAPDGSLASGKFFLKRPGKMRWQYHPPTPILMVSNGKTLVYYDYELEQVSHLSLDETLIGFLTHEKISFDKMVGITEVTQDKDAIRITLAQRKNPSEGMLMLEFSDAPLTLRNMVIRDATNQITSISLTNAKFDTKLDNDLFVFRDPRHRRKKK